MAFLARIASRNIGRTAFRGFHSSPMASMRLMFLGAPGVGKGTFSSRLAKNFDIPQISTGDLVRAEIKGDTELGREIKKISESGGLVPDETITDMLKARLTHDDAKKGFILDGYPRTQEQAKVLQEFCPLEMVVNIDLREDLLVQKICARRVCSGCGENYNLAAFDEGDIKMEPLLPKREGICDKCDGELKQRADDTEETVRHRLEIYHKETQPLEEFYNKQGILRTFAVKTGVTDTPVLGEAILKWHKEL